ncbi:MAG: hypothetical protein ABSG78_22465 [Verrucomicrobiota bacterium]|jgi:hypothetical protein
MALLPEDYKRNVESGSYDRFARMSELRAFRHLFFPKSVIREFMKSDPQAFSELQHAIKKALSESEDKEKRDKSTSA